MRTRFDSSSTARGCHSAIAARSSSACTGPNDTACTEPPTVGRSAGSLRPEPFDVPGVALAREAEPVVQTVFATLPELDRLGFEPVAAPVRRERHVVAREPLGDLGERRVELLPRAHRPALPGRPRAQPSLARPRPEVRLGPRVVDG